MSRRPAPPRPARAAPLALRFCGLRLRAPGGTTLVNPANVLDPQPLPPSQRPRTDLPRDVLPVVQEVRQLAVAALLKFLSEQLAQLNLGNASALGSDHARSRLREVTQSMAARAPSLSPDEKQDAVRLWALHSAEIELPREHEQAARTLCSYADFFNEVRKLRLYARASGQGDTSEIYQLLTRVLLSDNERQVMSQATQAAVEEGVQLREEALARLPEDASEQDRLNVQVPLPKGSRELQILGKIAAARFQILRLRLSAALLYPKLQLAVVEGLRAPPAYDALPATSFPHTAATLDFPVGCLPAKTEPGVFHRPQTRLDMRLRCVLCVSFRDINLQADLLPQLQAAAQRDRPTLPLPPLSGYAPLLRYASPTDDPPRPFVTKPRVLARRSPDELVQIYRDILTTQATPAWRALADLLCRPLSKPRDFLWRLLDENHPAGPNMYNQDAPQPPGPCAVLRLQSDDHSLERLALGRRLPTEAFVNVLWPQRRIRTIQDEPLPFVRLTNQLFSPGDPLNFWPAPRANNSLLNDNLFNEKFFALNNSKWSLGEYPSQLQYLAGMPLGQVGLLQNLQITRFSRRKDDEARRNELIELIQKTNTDNPVGRAFAAPLLNLRATQSFSQEEYPFDTVLVHFFLLPARFPADKAFHGLDLAPVR